MTSDIWPIVLIGAARSGTKILRDCLAHALDVPTVPYDIGYVWRYGNESCPHDALDPSQVRPKTRRLVRRFLSRYVDSRGVVIEKTVGNTLRVPYVAEILPEARFVHLIRDGVDVTESTRRQWQAPNDFRYLRDKVRHFPLRLAPTYGRKFVVAQTVGRRNRAHVATWGPRYRGIDQDLQSVGLLRVAARQWASSVEAGITGLEGIAGPVVQVRYERLVTEPAMVLTEIADALDHKVNPVRTAEAARMLVPASKNVGRGRLTASERRELSEEIGDILEDLGYERP